ncbi:hypothetical protein [Bacillus bombysepticus]|uniref:hypothetical protein n=1 Tax=Bacillus bombysepticus TaxID=658666 RepID=UPI003015D47C
MREILNTWLSAPYGWVYFPALLFIINIAFLRIWTIFYKKDKLIRQSISSKLEDLRQNYRSLYWEKAEELPLVEKCIKWVLVILGGGKREEISEFVKRQSHIEGYITGNILETAKISEIREKSKEIIKNNKGNMWRTIGLQLIRIYVFIQLLYVLSLLEQPNTSWFVAIVTSLVLFGVWWRPDRTIQIMLLSGLFFFLYIKMSLAGNLFLIITLGFSLVKKVFSKISIKKNDRTKLSE